MGKRSAGAPPTPGSDKKGKTPIVEIKESRLDKIRTDHVEQKSERHKDEKTQ
ncbi:MAG: hypothetical protein JSW59_07385 [Phycisphaerales bacterium]|nr:MAG: hypothetical protein JSW59_07385 [Phycisphaerales bacterium]